MEDLSEKVDVVHEQLLKEENLTVKDLPAELKQKIKGWGLLFSRLKKRPDDEKLFRSVQKQSIEIADKIQDFIESDYEDDDGSGGKGDDGKGDDGKGDDGKGDDGKGDKKPRGFGSLPMAKKIQMKIKENGDGRISVSDLKSIIGKEPDYPEQQVHNITLRKVFLASEYAIK